MTLRLEYNSSQHVFFKEKYVLKLKNIQKNYQKSKGKGGPKTKLILKKNFKKKLSSPDLDSVVVLKVVRKYQDFK
jgi:hypothetical protein